MRFPQTLNADNIIYCIKIFLTVMALLSIVAIYESVQSFHVEKYTTNTPLIDTRATPTSTSMFLRNEYRGGVDAVEIQHPGRLLGTDINHKAFAVEVAAADATDQHQHTKLQVFHADSRALWHEKPASGCSNVSRNNVVYCHNGQRSDVAAYHLFTGKSMFSFPTPDPDSHFELLSSSKDTDILLARNHNSGPATTNTVYSISGHHIRWSKKLDPNERCNVIESNRTLICQQPAGGGADATNIRTLQVSSGDDITVHRSATKVSITSNGWIEYPVEDVSAGKPREFVAFTADGRRLGTSRTGGPEAFFPFNTSGDLSNAETLTYPAHSYGVLEAEDQAILAADGAVTYRGVSHSDKPHPFFGLDRTEMQFSFRPEELLTASKDGTLLLVRSTDSSEQSEQPVQSGQSGQPVQSVRYQIFDTKNKNSFDIIETPDSVPQVINGTLAITHKPEAAERYGKLTVFLPQSS